MLYDLGTGTMCGVDHVHGYIKAAFMIDANLRNNKRLVIKSNFAIFDREVFIH